MKFGFKKFLEKIKKFVWFVSVRESSKYWTNFIKTNKNKIKLTTI